MTLSFLVFKGVLVLAALAFAVREVIVTGRPNSNPELTRKLLRVFSAGERARRPIAPAPPPAAAPTEPAEPELPRRAA
jgi:hypothetical protein